MASGAERLPRRRFGQGRTEDAAGCRLPLALLALTALLAALTGCSSPTVREADEPLAEAYRLAPGDKVAVRVLGHADLAMDARLDRDGRIVLPLIREVTAGGLTVPELRGLIAERLDKDFIVEPQVQVEIVEYQPFYVLGEVARPGSYPYRGPVDVRRAVAIAGGFTRGTLPGRIAITRERPDGRRSFAAKPESIVQPGDIIEVEAPW